MAYDDKTDLTLRDMLAMDRTLLANERTLLAYIRTAVAFVAGGIGMTQLLPHAWALWVGWASVATGVMVGGIGIYRFVRISHRIRQESALTKG